MDMKFTQPEGVGGVSAPALGYAPFLETLASRGLRLSRGETTTLQVNMGPLCNMSCRHCHLSAGPGRREAMDAKTCEHVADYARRGKFSTVDITGGAPELNRNFTTLISRVRPFVDRVLMRTNLSYFGGAGGDELISFLADHRVSIVASLPSLNKTQAEAQRGKEVFDKSLAALRKLNAKNYGREAGLTLDLVSNPSGAFLPPSQATTENRFRADLERKWGITFNRLFALANVPLGRYRDWLIESGNYETYFGKLVESFNNRATQGVMCRYQVSVAWDGYLYDCDFNIATGLHMGVEKIHVSRMESSPAPGSPIALADYCYACTAGSGFTCGGAIE